MLDNGSVVRRLFDEVINRGDLDAASELVTDDVVFRGRGGRAVATGVETFKRIVIMLRTSFSDYHFELEDLIAEGDKVVTRFTASGTHIGSYMNIPPTGKEVSYAAVDIFRLHDGKIEEVWSLSDQLHLMEQLGALSSLGERTSR